MRENPVLAADKHAKDEGKMQTAKTEFELFALLQEHHFTVSTAESCTGGMIASRLVNVPGASEVFTTGLVTYSNEAKMRLLGVKEETLAAWGAVSRETAVEMAEGGAGVNQTDLCIATTGIAGPDGGTPQKPVGLVYMACFLGGETKTRCYQFQGDRQSVREQAAQKALELAIQCLLEKGTKLLEDDRI